jgi:hypothetical protein
MPKKLPPKLDLSFNVEPGRRMTAISARGLQRAGNEEVRASTGEST